MFEFRSSPRCHERIIGYEHEALVRQIGSLRCTRTTDAAARLENTWAFHPGCDLRPSASFTEIIDTKRLDDPLDSVKFTIREHFLAAF